MDILSFVMAVTLALSSAGGETTTPSDATEARSHIIDLGAQSSSESPSPGDSTEARSHIIDLGNQ